MNHTHNTQVKEMTKYDGELISVPKEFFEEVSEVVRERKRWVTIDVVARFLHCSIRHVRNLISKRTIKRAMYAVAVTGLKTFNLPKIMRWKK